MSYFPFFTDISDKTFLIIGGGNVAADKILHLRRFTDRIIVIAPETEIEGVRVIRKEYDSGDLALGDYVVAAVGVRDIDRQIARDCRAAGIPVNVVDDIEYCDFIFPSIVKRGKLTVAISTLVVLLSMRGCSVSSLKRCCRRILSRCSMRCRSCVNGRSKRWRIRRSGLGFIRRRCLIS